MTSDSLNQNDDEGDLTDGRVAGAWSSKYPIEAWLFIALEVLFLLTVIISAGNFLVEIFSATPDENKQINISFFSVINFQFPSTLSQWLLILFSGVIGGATFDLKWLYHSVAKNIWHIDRILWRLSVPLISGIVSVFLAFLIVSGLIPFKTDTFENIYFAMGFGWLFGYFSDNVIGWLHNIAQKIFGRVDSNDDG